jgi:hypothetical protein
MDNKILNGELCLLFDAAEVQWRRVLMMHEGTYVEVDLSPRNYPKAEQRQWEQIHLSRMRMHNRARKPGDRQYRFVQAGSPIHSVVWTVMMKGGMYEGDVAMLMVYRFLESVDLVKLKNNTPAFLNEVKK